MVACTPNTGLGTVAVQRAAYVQVVNLVTCKQSKVAGHPKTASPVTVRVTPTGQSIVYRGRIADGLTLNAVRVAGGRSFTVGFGLAYDDYRVWCGVRCCHSATRSGTTATRTGRTASGAER